MKALGIIGYHKSGKTTLGVNLCRELSGRGLRVGVVKHVSCELQFADADSSRYRSFASVVAATSAAEAEIIVKGEKSLQEMLWYCAGCDVVLWKGSRRKDWFRKSCVFERRRRRKNSSTVWSFSPLLSKKESPITSYPMMSTCERWRISLWKKRSLSPVKWWGKPETSP